MGAPTSDGPRAIALLPGEGSDLVAFGATRKAVRKRLGEPGHVNRIGNVEGYPIDRELWDYGTLDVLFAAGRDGDGGVIGVTVDATFGAALLWGTSVFEADRSAIARLAAERGLRCDETVEQWGDATLSVREAGLLVYCDDQAIEAIEVYLPSLIVGPPDAGSNA